MLYMYLYLCMCTHYAFVSIQVSLWIALLITFRCWLYFLQFVYLHMSILAAV